MADRIAMNIFVTGTDTDAGKTVASAWLCKVTSYKYWKPIQTGPEEDHDRNVIGRISKSTEILNEVYKLKAPLSPYDSARLENVEIDIGEITSAKPSGETIIEGAGGALVPITPNCYVADLINKLDAKAVVVAKSKLGFLNHIFLTLEALRTRNVGIIGAIINGDVSMELIDTIERFGKTRVIKVLPFMKNLDEEFESVKPSHELLSSLL